MKKILIILFSVLIISEANGMESDVLKAAQAGDVTRLESAIREGEDLNTKDQYDQTPLMLASEAGHTDVVKLLINRGADVNARNVKGGTALMFAAFNGHFEIVRLLLNKGANVDAKGESGQTALLRAVVKRKPAAARIIKLLLDSGADINAQETDTGWTALMMAVYGPPPPPPLPRHLRSTDPATGKKAPPIRNVQKDIVKTLIDGGADLTVKNYDGETALMLAESMLSHFSEHKPIVELLKKAGAKE